MKPNIKFGIILGGALMFISLLLYALGMDKNETVSKIAGIFNIILPAIITFLGIKALRDENQNGFITFGQGFSCGMVISIVGAAISGIYSYLYFVVINPGMVTYVRMKQEEEMLSRGLSESEVEKMSGTVDHTGNDGCIRCDWNDRSWTCNIADCCCHSEKRRPFSKHFLKLKTLEGFTYDGNTIHQLFFSDYKWRCETNDISMSRFCQQSVFCKFHAYIPCFFAIHGFYNNGIE